MGEIASAFASAFRDYQTSGLPSSGANEPVKSEIRAIGPIIESVMGTLSLGSLNTYKTTKDLLDADLAHDANSTALVYADPVDANNDLYIKSGASGSGSWTNTHALHNALEGILPEPDPTDLTLLTIDSTGARILFIPPGTLDANNVFVSGIDENGEVGTGTGLASGDANSVQIVQHLVGHGQSLSLGQQGTPAIDTTVLDAGRGLMFAGSVQPGDNSLGYVLDAARIAGFVDLEGPSRVGNEHVLVRATHGLLTELPDDVAVLASAHGVGGEAYVALKQGTQPYRNMLYAMRQAAKLTGLSGLEYRVFALDWIHGEDNYEASKAAYLGYLVELQADFEADANSIARRSDTIPLVTDQSCSWTKYYNTTTSFVPEAQLQASLDEPTKFVCVGPKYHLAYDDGIHLTAASYRILGEYHGRALAALAAGDAWTPLHAVSANRVGTAVTVTCHVPEGALVRDTTLVSDPGQSGMTYRDGSNNLVAISSIAVVGSTITFTLASAVAGTLRFGLEGTAGNNAGPTTGPRTCFRDSSADMAADGTTHLYNWMCHQALPVA